MYVQLLSPRWCCLHLGTPASQAGATCEKTLVVGLAFLGQFLLSSILAVGLTFTFLGPPALGPDPRLSPIPGAQPRSQVRQCQGQVAGSPAAASSEAIHPLSPTSRERSRGTLVKVWWRWSPPSQLDDLSFFIGEVKDTLFPLQSLLFFLSRPPTHTQSLSTLGIPGRFAFPFLSSPRSTLTFPPR